MFSALPVHLPIPGCWALTAAIVMLKFLGSVKLTCPENQCHIMRRLENWKHKDLGNGICIALNPISPWGRSWRVRAHSGKASCRCQRTEGPAGGGGDAPGLEGPSFPKMASSCSRWARAPLEGEGALRGWRRSRRSLLEGQGFYRGRGAGSPVAAVPLSGGWGNTLLTN